MDAALEVLNLAAKEDPDCPIDFAKKKEEIEKMYQPYKNTIPD